MEFKESFLTEELKMDAYRLNKAWSETTAGTNAGAVATHAAAADVVHFVTVISGHTDTDSVVTVSNGAAIVAEWIIDISVAGLAFEFTGLWAGSAGAAVVGSIVTSTSDCQVNMCGFSLP